MAEPATPLAAQRTKKEIDHVSASGHRLFQGPHSPVVRFVALATAVLAIASAVPSARADMSLTEATIETVANARTPDPTVAGAHPDLHVRLVTEWDETGLPIEDLRSVRLDLPPGMVPNTAGIPTCPRSVFRFGGGNACPASSLVGLGTVWLSSSTALRTLRVVNVQPGPDEPARLGLVMLGINGGPLGMISVSVTPDGDYAVKTVADEMFNFNPIKWVDMTLWGVPGDHPETGGTTPRPFMANGTQCGGPQPVPISVDSVQNSYAYTYYDRSLPPLTGCDSLAFDTSIAVLPEAPWAGSVSPVSVDVGVDQSSSDDPDGRLPSTLRDATVVLPEGLSLNPGGAGGLAACSDADFDKGSGGVPACPVASKVGEGSIETPVLADAIPADVYVGAPLPGQMFRLFVYAEGRGVKVKLEGKVDPDPVTGRLTARFEDNPPLPFSNLRLRFRGGGRGVLAMPSSCGLKSTAASYVPWSGRPASVVGDAFEVFAGAGGGLCPDPQPFSPSFVAGSTGANAGGDTGFTLTFGRRDVDQLFGGVDVELPEGLLGRLAGVPMCSIADADGDHCSSESLVGSVSVSAGASDSILTLPGRVYLTQAPKRGQVAGLAVVVPAVAGPYDLGDVVVHAGVEVDPSDASVRVVADDLPTIVGGVPLRLRQVTVNIDRPGFMVNPTDCAAKQVAGTLASVGGTLAKVATAFQPRECTGLQFGPSLGMRLTGAKSQMREEGHPGLRAVLTQKGGQANIAKARVRLPLSLALDPDNAKALCGYDQAQGDDPDCPTGAIVGRAGAKSPALDGKLSGPVYLVQGIRTSETGQRIRTLPTLLTTLRSDTYPGLEIHLRARTGADSKGHLITTFGGIPDVPVSRFSLTIDGGHSGILAATRNPCPIGQRIAKVGLRAQNGDGTNTDRILRSSRGCAGSRR
jgi:hypothetical protein